MSDTNITIYDFVTSCAKEFEKTDIFLGHGTDNYWDEAAYLTMSVLDLAIDITEEESKNKISEQNLSKLTKVMNARINTKMPLPYLTGVAWYRGNKFYVNESTIIPRSPIGEIIDNDFFGFIDTNHPLKILDLCTGSGALAILIALAAPQAQVDAVDISTAALEIAKKNIEYYELADRVHLLESDLFEQCADNEQYDLIISNPPYVGDNEYQNLPEEFKHEPKIALVSEQDGFEIPLTIVGQASKFLKQGGGLILEVGYSAEKFDKLIEKINRQWLELSEGGEGVVYISKEAL